MKRVLTVALPLAALVLVAGVAFAQMGGGMTGGMGGGTMGGMGSMMGGGMMGGGMMGGMGGMMGGDGQQGAGTDCHGDAAGAQSTQMKQEDAEKIATAYAGEHNLTFVKVEPLTGMHMAMWTAELRDASGAVRMLHISPSGHVMDHAAPGTQG
ncbi:MAG: hypothetical protein HYU51_10455 [Candidatus Rokubacteria bacterium]|nr:hypothetical protein [Candidatus Rokubacteria bacterium]